MLNHQANLKIFPGPSDLLNGNPLGTCRKCGPAKDSWSEIINVENGKKKTKGTTSLNQKKKSKRKEINAKHHVKLK